MNEWMGINIESLWSNCLINVGKMDALFGALERRDWGTEDRKMHHKADALELGLECSLLLLQTLPRLAIQSVPHVLAHLVAVQEGTHPLPSEVGQPPSPAIDWLTRQPSDLLKILLKIGKHHGELGPVALDLYPVLLPFLHLLHAGKLGPARQDPSRQDRLPFKDLEGQAGPDGPNKHECGIPAVHHVLIQFGHSVVPGHNLGEERQCPRVAGAKNDGIHIRNGSTVDKMNRAGLVIDGFDGRMLLDPRMMEGAISKVAVGRVADGNRVDRKPSSFGMSEIVGNIGSRHRSSYNHDSL